MAAEDKSEVLTGTVLPALANAESRNAAADAFGIAQPAAERSRMNAADAYLQTLHPGTSRENVRSKLNNVARVFGCADYRHIDWSSMRYEHILQFIRDRQEPGEDGLPKLSSRSINCYVSALKGVARQAYLLGQIDNEALTRISLVKSIRYSRLSAGRSISQTESRALLESAKGNAMKATRDYAILALLLGCGLRRAEVAGLLLENYSRRDESIRLIGKGEKERKVFLIEPVIEALEAWLRVRSQEGLFVFGRFYKNDKFDATAPMTPHAVGDIVREYQIKAGLEHLSTHDLRRTFATRLLDENVDITTVQNMMGHASIATTALYDHRGESVQRRAARKIKL